MEFNSGFKGLNT